MHYLTMKESRRQRPDARRGVLQYALTLVMITPVASRNLNRIQFLLLNWFKKYRRALPWRETRDPYKIWVSEIMLQQTQVKTVIPYYERWIKIFPTIEALAKAPLSRVLKCWEGLGYYSRARNFHRAAEIVAQKLGGKIPDSVDELVKLPGIGRYTAGAIASIAFNKPEPILDGNVARVLARVFALRDPVDQNKGKEKLWEIAKILVKGVNLPSLRTPRKRGEAISEIASAPLGMLPRNDSVGNFNQALMELGALVCLSENPKCFICPLKKICKAHRLKKETEFPVKARWEKTEKLKTVAAVIWKNGRVLLQKQPLEARWGGLWMFPQWIHRNGKRDQDFLSENIEKDFGLRVKGWEPRLEVKHGFTKYRVHLTVYEGGVIGSSKAIVSPVKVLRRGEALTRWLKPRTFDRLPFPSPHQKIAELLQSNA